MLLVFFNPALCTNVVSFEYRMIIKGSVVDISDYIHVATNCGIHVATKIFFNTGAGFAVIQISYLKYQFINCK